MLIFTEYNISRLAFEFSILHKSMYSVKLKRTYLIANSLILKYIYNTFTMIDLIVEGDIYSENIRYEIDNINYFNNKIIPYNAKSKIPLHKFWVYIDKCKIIKKNVQNDFSSIIIALSLSCEGIKNIRTTEKVINKKLIEEEITRFILISKLTDHGSGIPTFELVIDDKTVLFDENDKKIQDIKTINCYDEMSALCELDYFLLTNNYLKTSWKAVQLKKIQSINLSTSLFPKYNETINIVNPVNNISAPQFAQQISQQIKNHQLSQSVQPTQLTESMRQIRPAQPAPAQQKKAIFVIPSPADLANALSGLKKVKPHGIDIPKKKNENEYLEGPQLKHVETKESNIYQMLKDEHTEKEQIKKQERRLIIDEQLKSINKLDHLRKKSIKYHSKLTYLLDPNMFTNKSSKKNTTDKQVNFE